MGGIGNQYVEFGGIAIDTMVGSAVDYEVGVEYELGVVSVFAGGVASGMVLLSWGQGVVEFGGVISGAVVNGGDAIVLGIASGTTLLGGGQQTIDLGGIAAGTIVNSGGYEEVHSGGLPYQRRSDLRRWRR